MSTPAPRFPAIDDTAFIDPPLLDLLLRAPGFQTPQALALQRGCTLEALTGALAALQRAGCPFDHHPLHGLKLLEAGLPCWSDYLAFILGPAAGPVAIYESTASTQDLARRYLETRGPQETPSAVFVANQQTAGRGRLGRRWETPAGTALLFSRLCAHVSPERLTLGASIALCRAIDPYLASVGLRAAIKWPNDVFVAGRKIAGILVERAGPCAVLGIGLNVSLQPEQMPPTLRDRATSLHQLGAPAHRLRVLAELLALLEEILTMADPAPLLAEWRARCIQLHQPVHFHCQGRDYEGQVLDLSPEEGLVLRTHQGELIHLPAATTRTV